MVTVGIRGGDTGVFLHRIEDALLIRVLSFDENIGFFGKIDMRN